MRIFYTVAGSVSLALGIIGIFVPLLPTTPFLLLAAALYFKASPRLYDWLINHKYLGTYIRNYRENKAIPFGVKALSVSLLWFTILFSVIFIVQLWWVKLILLAVAAGVTFHILSFKTLK